MGAKGGMGGVDSAALADLETEVGEIKRHVMVVDDVKVQLMAVSDRLNALTEYLVSDTRSFALPPSLHSNTHLCLHPNPVRTHCGVRHNGHYQKQRELLTGGGLSGDVDRVFDVCSATKSTRQFQTLSRKLDMLAEALVAVEVQVLAFEAIGTCLPVEVGIPGIF